jgi:hypothetical protein
MHGRIRVLILVGSIVAAGIGVAAAAAPSPVHPLPHPLPEPGFLEPVPAGECTSTNEYETKLWSGYGDKCKRLHFVFGPIFAKPGQNDVLIEPVTIQKPAYDGYIVRFRPDLVDVTGQPPSIEEIHLHHATWLNVYPQYGSGPFFAAGEEKTIATFPPGYGMHVGATDTWLLLYMVHNAIQTPRPVWITYDVDFVAEEDAEALGIVPVKPVWLDVQQKPIAPGATDTGGNPVFNVQRGFGATDSALFGDPAIGAGTGRNVCSWPEQNCARHDVYGNVTPQQGVPITVPGADWTVGEGFEGTLIGIGGHLHPGGIRDEVSLVRNGVEKPIFFSEAVPWEHNDVNDNGKIDAGVYDELDSWDFSMTVTGSTLGWKVKIAEGDILRLNAIYDSQNASWYENMGIVVAMVVPKEYEDQIEKNAESLAYHGGLGIDVFDDNVILDQGLPVLATEAPGWATPSCTPDAVSPTKRLCLRGQVTHGHMEEASHHGGAAGPALPEAPGQVVDQLVSVGFTYGQADLGLAGTMGVPQLKLGKSARFWNLDSPLDIWHTWTRCKEPCTGGTGISYPLANGGTGLSDTMDFDSTEIGYGLFFSPASGQLGGPNKSTGEALQDGLFWDFTPSQTGTFSLFCRIHPFMRGVFQVVE